MRIFVAGASGVIGTRLVPLLVAAGHEVAGMTRSDGKAAMLRELGADPVVCDVFDPDAVHAAVVRYARRGRQRADRPARRRGQAR